MNTKSNWTVDAALKHELSFEFATVVATPVPPDAKPEASLTTATNCESAGYVSWNWTSFWFPGNGISRI